MRAGLVSFIAAIGLPLLAAADIVVPIDSVQYFVNVRAEPDSDSDVIARLYRGDSMPHVQSVDGWHKIKIEEDFNGYISADWTKVLSEADAQAAAADAARAEELPEAAETVEEEVVEQAAVAENESAELAGETVPVVSPDEVIEDAPAGETVVEDPADASELPIEALEQEAGAEVRTPEPAVEPEQEEELMEAEELPAEHDVAQFVTVPPGPQGPQGDRGPPGPPGAASLQGSVNFLTKFTEPTVGGSSQVYDDGRSVGIGTTEPKQRLEVNGSIQIHERNSSVAGLMITQSSGETGYIMHNRGSTLTIGAGSVDRITIDSAGNVGIGKPRPSHPLDMASGAHVTAGGVWTNSSSRQGKDNIAKLTPEEALAALAKLEPVRFNYKGDVDDEYVGFIAEDVPELVASKDRTGLSAMDIVAVLTKVVQEQQERIEELEARLKD